MDDNLFNAKRYSVMYEGGNCCIVYHKGPVDPHWVTYEEAHKELLKYLRHERDRAIMIYHHAKIMNQFSHVEQFTDCYDIPALSSNGTVDKVKEQIRDQIEHLKLQIRCGAKQIEAIRGKISRLTLNLFFWENIKK